MVNKNYESINAASQIEDKDSVFSFYKELIKLRKSEEFKEVIVYGKFRPMLEEYDNIVAFCRELEDKKIMIIANYQNEEQIIKLPEKFKGILLNNYDSLEIEKDKVRLQEYEVVILEIY